VEQCAFWIQDEYSEKKKMNINKTDINVCKDR
jgi:hypothetical protein